MWSFLRQPLFIVAGAAVLLLPAQWWGRPFVFSDTAAYWGWGRDCLEALLRPWPQAGQPWISGRPLHGWEIGAHGASAGDLRFTLTLLTARSAFYALPFYVLTRAGGLWLVAALQAWLAAWTVRVASRAFVPAMSGLAYLVLIFALTVFTTLGFEAGYAMPDLLGGLALLAACTLIAAPTPVGLGERLGLCAVMTYAGLVHAENVLNLAAAVGLCVLFHWRAGATALIGRTVPIAGSLTVALALSFVGTALLGGAFGRPLQMAPFAASRVLADGAAQPYLRQACARTRLAACDLATAPPVNPEYYLGAYPLQPPPGASSAANMYDRIQFASVSDEEADHRDRFVAEQARLVLGALQVDGVHELRAAIANGAETFMAVGINPDLDSLAALMREHTQRRVEIVAITPGAPSCATSGARSCGALDVGVIAPLQKSAFLAAVALLGLGLVRNTSPTGRPLQVLAAGAIALVMANAFLCGALAGPFDRYQLRVEWLVPFCALLQALAWVQRRSEAARTPMVPSGAPMAATPPVKARA
jgi:hypothetical protein